MDGGPTTSPTLDPRRRRLGLTTGLPAVLLGIAAIALSRTLDGFVGGLFSGGGVTLVAFGAYLVATTVWPRSGGDGATGEWLPSRDGERPGRRSEP